MKTTQALVLLLCFFMLQSFIHTSPRKKIVVVWQPSHQTDTGKDFSEAEVCNAIAGAAMHQKGYSRLKEFKVWSLGKTEYHHHDRGSNTKIEHTSAIIDGKRSGYAQELQQSNQLNPDIFISIHNNGGTNRHAVWGFIHYGDAYESDNRELAAVLVQAISNASGLENRGVLMDSSTGRNDYRCAATGKLAFYSLDEQINKAPYRVLLEIGDNAVSRDLLLHPASREKIGIAIKKALIKWIRKKNFRSSYSLQ